MSKRSIAVVFSLFLFSGLFFFQQLNTLAVRTISSQAEKTKGAEPINQEKKVLSAATLLAQAGPTATPAPTATPTPVPPTPTPTPVLVSISGNVFLDYDRDQIKDATEPSKSGVTITLSGLKSATATTNASGNYSFANLVPGSYTVTITVPSRHSGTTPTSRTATVLINNTTDFGIIPYWNISGNVFVDANANKVKDTGETNFAGVTVKLTGATSATDITDGSGNYSFTNIYGGNDYTLSIQMPTSYTSTTSNSYNITLNADLVQNFGLRSTSTITAGDICAGTSLDIMIVFDHSDSMRLEDPATGRPKFSAAKEAALAFVDVVEDNLPTARIGLTQFAGSYNYPNYSETRVLVNETSNFASVKSAISAMQTAPFENGGTCFECALDLSNKALQNATRANSQKLTIFMTDGVANQVIAQPGVNVSASTAENAAMEEVTDGINEQNIVYNVIGVGSGGNEDAGINEAFLKQVANANAGDYYNDPSMGDLNSIYNSLAASIIPSGKITGFVFDDSDFDGVRDSGEPGLSSWSMQLSQGNTTLKTAVTDSNGAYTFSGLCTNPHAVTEIVKSGWFPTTPGTRSVNVVNGSTYPNINFGNKQRFDISGNIYIDVNKNGVKDTGETNYTGPISITSTDGTIATTSTGTYTISNLLSDSSVRVSYATLPADYVMTYPLNGPPPSFTVAVGSSCSTNGARGAACSGGDIVNLNFGISNLYPWYQSSCGDIRIDSGITNRLYAGNAAMVTNSSCTNPGIAFSGDSPYSFGQGQISSTNWVVGGTTYPETFQVNSPILSSFVSLVQKAAQGGIPSADMANVCTLSSCTLPANLTHGIYRANTNVIMNAYTFQANQSYVFLIDGNLTINGSLLVPRGSSAVFAVTGNIIVDDAVGTTDSSTTPSIEGVYTTDRSFIINSAGTCTDKRLNIGGSIVVNAAGTGGTFQNNRDLCSGDRLYPTVSFVQRLDFLFSLPTFLRSRNMYSWEAAP